MITKLFTRRRCVEGREIQEPTVLAIVLVGLGFVVLLGAMGWAVCGVTPHGAGVWGLAVVAAALAGLILVRRRRPAAVTRRQAWSRRVGRAGRVLCAVLLACWLGLIGWSQLSPGGPMPAPRADPDMVRVLTWNIYHGSEKGAPWKWHDWARRKPALRAALDGAAPDVLCVQEAVAEQVAFLEKALPGHSRVGVGRDDGQSGGEFCAIYFNRARFEEIGGGTFWLEEPTDRPLRRSALNPHRICTWARLRERGSGRVLRVYNTHQYLTEKARVSAARVILAHITAGDPTDAVLVAGDFNASPGAPSRVLFAEAGLTDSAELAGKAPGAATYHFYGLRLRSLDGILVSPDWDIHSHQVLDVRPNNTFPSNHFGVLADLTLRP
ncbi:MAG: endonuclease/exonuclease/phosphatase family protein [Gemmataceae bacterium]|nr:endonuclease/exonuclease/phosphatase family protein [Gemmataceae bacterium]